MKRLSFIIAIWFVYFQIHRAHANSEVHIAIKGGLDAAKLDHDFRENRYDFSGGVAGYLQAPVSERFSLAGQIEFLYTPRGANVVFDGEKQAEFRDRYVDLVTAVRPEVKLGPASVYLLLGGSLNLLVNATMESVTGAKQDITGDLHRIDVALLGGAGVALHLSRRASGPFHLGTVFLETRHDIGLLDPFTTASGFKNRTSSLMLGLSFVVGGPGTPAPDTP